MWRVYFAEPPAAKDWVEEFRQAANFRSFLGIG